MDIDRIVRPRVAALEALIKEGKAETDKGREVRGHRTHTLLHFCLGAKTLCKAFSARPHAWRIGSPVGLWVWQVIISILQGALRVHSLYLSNGSYMELSLRPLTHLNTWLRAVLAARTDISRIQRRASKLNVKHPGRDSYINTHSHTFGYRTKTDFFMCVGRNASGSQY